MSRVYISGPMTGIAEFNYPAFHVAAARLRAAGFDVVSPHEINPEGGHWTACMRRDIVALMDCDRIVTLPGWERSKGAKIEIDLGLALGMDVVDMEYLLTLPAVVTRGCPA